MKLNNKHKAKIRREVDIELDVKSPRQIIFKSKKKYTKVLLRGGKKYQNESVWVKLISGDIEKGVGTIANDPINPKYSFGEK